MKKKELKKNLRNTEEALLMMYSAYLECRKATVSVSNENVTLKSQYIAADHKAITATGLLTKEQRERLGFPGFVVLSDRN